MSSKPFDPEDTQEFKPSELDYRTAPQYIVVYTPAWGRGKKRYSHIQFPGKDVPSLDGYTSVVIEIQPGEDLSWLNGWRQI